MLDELWLAASDATPTWTSCWPWSARLRSEAFLRERVRELEASELAQDQALSLDERHGVPPHLDADVCLATYLSVQTLERERRSVVMRPALREQERRLRLFLRRKEEARRTWGWSSCSSPAPCALNGTILVTAAGQSTSTSSVASTRPSAASTCRSRRPCRVLPSPPPRAQAHRHRPRSKQLGAQRSAERACWSMSRRRRLPLAVKS